LTAEIDLDEGRRPMRIRLFGKGVLDSEAQFTGWGRQPVPTAPRVASPATVS
jgi:hypothetical protein